jgi:hypothetical protein
MKADGTRTLNQSLGVKLAQIPALPSVIQLRFLRHSTGFRTLHPPESGNSDEPILRFDAAPPPANRTKPCSTLRPGHLNQPRPSQPRSPAAFAARPSPRAERLRSPARHRGPRRPGSSVPASTAANLLAKPSSPAAPGGSPAAPPSGRAKELGFVPRDPRKTLTRMARPGGLEPLRTSPTLRRTRPHRSLGARRLPSCAPPSPAPANADRHSRARQPSRRGAGGATAGRGGNRWLPRFARVGRSSAAARGPGGLVLGRRSSLRGRALTRWT